MWGEEEEERRSSIQVEMEGRERKESTHIRSSKSSPRKVSFIFHLEMDMIEKPIV